MYDFEPKPILKSGIFGNESNIFVQATEWKKITTHEFKDGNLSYRLCK